MNGTVVYRDLDRSKNFTYGIGEPFDESEQVAEIDFDGNQNTDPAQLPAIVLVPDDDDLEEVDLTPKMGLYSHARVAEV